MSDTKTLTNETDPLFDDLIESLERDDLNPPIDGRFPDGTYYVYDDELQATIEVTPDARRFIVKYQKGQGLVRIKDLGVNAA